MYLELVFFIRLLELKAHLSNDSVEFCFTQLRLVTKALIQPAM